MTEEGKEVWIAFVRNEQIALKTCGEVITELLEDDMGFYAVPTGNFYIDVVQSAAFHKHLGYRESSRGMQTSAQVLAKKELKQPKFRREDHLFARKASLINHTLYHKCSAYCLKDEQFSRPYDPLDDQDQEEKDCYMGTVNAVPRKMITVPCRECRMHFFHGHQV